MTPEDKDIQLMLRIKLGDKAAFEELYHLYKQPIGNFFYRLCGNSDLAEEYLQEVFYRVWVYRHQYQPRAKVFTYLLTIAKNFWINEAKRIKHQPVSFTTLSSTSKDSNFKPESLWSDGKILSPEQQSLKRELATKVNQAILKLPDKERLVLVLSEYEGLKYQEIAEVLQIAEGTVKMRMAKALNRLRKYLKKYL